MAAPPKQVNSVHDKYPDNDKLKEVFIQADGKSYPGYGDRHVMLWWCNFEDVKSATFVTQVVQLTGQISLGNLTREQHTKILDLAKNVQFHRKSTVNGCRAWTRDLLESMVNHGLTTKDKFERIDAEIPLVKRNQEA